VVVVNETVLYSWVVYIYNIFLPITKSYFVEKLT